MSFVADRLNTTVVNYMIYTEDEKEFLGTSQVTLPDLSFMTHEVKGSGVMGAITVPVISQLQNMQVQFQMLVLSDQTFKLAEHKVQTVVIYEVQQNQQDTPTYVMDVASVKHTMKIMTTQMPGGTLQPQSTSNPTITASVLYWKTERDGKKMLELDPLRYICEINGTDYAAKIRTAMGKT